MLLAMMAIWSRDDDLGIPVLGGGGDSERGLPTLTPAV